MIVYRFGPFRLLPDQRRLERDGATVAMTPKAFDLLVALVRHRSRALSKDELLQLVWSGASVEEGNLAQQVLLLRRALAAAGDCVSTVPRHGYHFVAPVIEENDASRRPIDSPHCLIWNDHEVSLREGITLIGRAEDADLRIRRCHAITRASSSGAPGRRSRILAAGTGRGEARADCKAPSRWRRVIRSGLVTPSSSTGW